MKFLKSLCEKFKPLFIQNSYLIKQHISLFQVSETLEAHSSFSHQASIIQYGIAINNERESSQ